MGIWITIRNIWSKDMQKEKWLGDMIPVRVFKNCIKNKSSLELYKQTRLENPLGNFTSCVG